jgi:hypothetical protein
VAVPVFEFRSRLFRIPGKGGWTFAAVPKKYAPSATRGWGMAPVLAIVDGYEWRTSVWREKSGRTLLPVPRAARRDRAPGLPRHMSEEFTYRSARSGSLVAGLGLAIAVEMVALHLWLAARHPVFAWLLTASSLAALLWLVADYRALGRGAVRLDDHALELSVGWRFALRLAPDDVATAVRPGWRDLPQAGTPAAAGYQNLMKPATPNVLLTLVAPTIARLPGGLRRPVQRLGLHLDEPDRFLTALRRRYR